MATQASWLPVDIASPTRHWGETRHHFSILEQQYREIYIEM